MQQREIEIVNKLGLHARASAKLTQLAAELTHQYKATYARPQSLIPPERVTVAAAKPGITARGTLIKEDKGRP